MDKDVKKLETLCAIGRDVKWSSSCGKAMWPFPTTLKIDLAYHPASPVWGYIPTKMESKVLKRNVYTRAQSSVIHNGQEVEVI